MVIPPVGTDERRAGDGGAPDVGAPLVRLRGIRKRFGATYALRDVDLELRGGEVHGLVGANGSGKSTLVKILSGYHEPDPGSSAEIGGEPVDLPPPPAVLAAARIGFVHQDLGLVPELSVLENLWLTRISQMHVTRIPWSGLKRRGTAILDDYHIRLDLDASVSDLSQTQRALLAITRAAATVDGRLADTSDGAREQTSPGVLVLDEATVFLSASHRELLQRIVAHVTAAGGAVLLITHDLDEAVALCDRILVLRDGRAAALVERDQADRAALAHLVVGDAVQPARAGGEGPGSGPGEDLTGSATVLVSGMRSGRHGVRDVSFRIAPGEILGFAGLAGSGFDQVVSLMFGAGRAEAGNLTVGTWRSALADLDPPAAINAGLAYIPAGRGSEGLLLDLSVEENLLSQVSGRYLRGGFLRHRLMRTRARQLVDEFGIRCRSVEAACAELSGGNQQKVLLAKWLESGPVALLLVEPTQGIDVGAREMIWGKLTELAGAGMTVVCASSDHEELARLATRVLVMRTGRVIAEISGPALTKTAITAACLA
jgi:ribose transport system ATP-binding protein